MTDAASVQIERDLLAAILPDASVLSQISWLNPGDFQDAGHQEIFSAIKRLDINLGAIPLSLIGGQIEVSRRTQLLALVAELAQLDALPAFAPQLARMLAERTHDRDIQHMALVLSQDPANVATKARLLELLNAPAADHRGKSSLPLLRSGRDLRALDVKVEWVVEGLIPRDSVVLLYGRGGIGKTTLSMMLADAVDKGITIFGMKTTQTPVIVIDFENSLAVLSERAKQIMVDGVLFCDSSSNPPRLDKRSWVAYKELLKQYPGAMFIFDTLRSSHSGDENDSETMALIMCRLRELRNAGATVVVLHHTPKGNDRQFKGSGAIFDLCDQTLALYQTTNPGSEQEADDDDDATDKVYRFGTGKKTRYRPHHVFLRFDPGEEIFVLATDPETEALERLHHIITALNETTCAKQIDIVAAAETDEFDFGGQKKIRAILKKGEGVFWRVKKGLNNSHLYEPIRFGSLATPIEGAKLPNREVATKTSGTGMVEIAA